MARELTKRDNLVPDRKNRSCPRETKRGDSARYPRRKDDTKPVRHVQHTIVLHLLTPPAPSGP